MRTVARDGDAELAQQPDQAVHIHNVRDIVVRHRLIGQQAGAEHLQRFIFGALRNDGAVQPVAAFNQKIIHRCRWEAAACTAV